MIITSDPWTAEENIKLYNALTDNQDWNEIQKLFPNRRLSDIKKHYISCPSANPNVNFGHWNEKEAQDFLEAYEIFGKKWKNIAEFVKTRLPSQCNSYWVTHFKKPGEHAYRIYRF